MGLKKIKDENISQLGFEDEYLSLSIFNLAR